MQSMYKVEWLQSASDIAQSLWDECFAAPYEGRWWYEAFEAAQLDDQFEFSYALVTEDGRQVAIAPAFSMNVPIELVIPPALLPIFKGLGKLFPSMLYQRTLFIGSPCSDEGRVGMLSGVDAKNIFAAINQSMVAQSNKLGARMRVWKDFAGEHEASFIGLIRSQGLFHMVSFPGTSLLLEGIDKNGYMGSLKSSRRGKLKKKLNQANQAPVFVEIIHQPNMEQMDEIFGLFWQTYEKGGTKFERLNRQFFEALSNYEHAHYVVLRKNDTHEMLAFMLCFVEGSHIINKFIGIDYQQPKDWFLYFRLWEAAVEWSYSVGGKSIQSGQTGYAPKIELGNEMVPLSNYCQHKNPVINFIYALVAKTINWDTLDSDLAIYLKAYPEHKPKHLK